MKKKYALILLIMLMALVTSFTLFACNKDDAYDIKTVNVSILDLTWIEDVDISDDGSRCSKEDKNAFYAMTDLLPVDKGDFINADVEGLTENKLKYSVALYAKYNGDYNFLMKLTDEESIAFDDLLLSVKGEPCKFYIRISIVKDAESTYDIKNGIEFLDINVVKRTEPQKSEIFGDFSSSPFMIAHRGYDTYGEYPENTMASYKAAVDKGFKIIESDVNFTSDNVAVMLHDDEVDRTSNGSGKIEDLTFETVRSLDFGIYKGEKFKGEKIPTLYEFLTFCHENGIWAELDLTKKPFTETQKKIIVDAVVETEMIKKTIFTSYDSDLSEYLKINPDLYVCVSTVENLKDASVILPKYGDKNLVLASMWYTWLDETLAKYIKSLGVYIKPYTANSAETVEELTDLGADFIITDTYTDLNG